MYPDDKNLETAIKPPGKKARHATYSIIPNPLTACPLADR